MIASAGMTQPHCSPESTSASRSSVDATTMSAVFGRKLRIWVSAWYSTWM